MPPRASGAQHVPHRIEDTARLVAALTRGAFGPTKFMAQPMGTTQYRLAKEIGVPKRRIGEIVAGTRGVTADTGLRLSRFFGMPDGFWTGLQMDRDAAQTREALAKTLARITPWTGHSVVAQQQVPTAALASASLRQGRR